MENASKALLIAGAVLIVILLIGIGMLIYSRSTGVVDTAANSMNAQQIQAFNSQFTPYEGNQPTTSVKNLAQAVISNNATYKNNSDKQISIVITNWTGTGDSTFSGEKPNEISNYVINKLNYKKGYTVSFEYNDNGLIRSINLDEIK